MNPHWIHPDPAWHGIALPSFRWRQVIVCHLFNGIYVHWMRTFIPWAAVLMSSLYQLAIWIKYSYSGFPFILKYQSLEPSNMWYFQFGRFAFCSIHSPQCFLSMCRNAEVVCFVVSTPRCHVGCGWVSSPAAGDFPFLVATLLEGMGQAGNLRGAKQRNIQVFATTKNPWIEMIRIDFSFRLYRLRTLKAKNV